MNIPTNAAKSAAARFTLYAIISGLLYFSFFFLNLAKPLWGDDQIVLKYDISFVLLIAISFALIYLYIKMCARLDREKITFRRIFLLVAVFSAILLAVWPMTSTDIFTYIYRSRVTTVYHANPYIVPYDAFPQDAFYGTLKNVWSGNTAVYAPLFIYIGDGLALLGGNNLPLNVFLFKLFAAALFIASVFLIYRLTGSRKAVFLYGLNPYLLFEFVVNGHNDILMIFLLFLSLLFSLRDDKIKTKLLGWVFLVLSVLVKYFTAIFLPFFLLYAWREFSSRRKRIVFLSAASFSAILLVFLFFAPLWDGPAIFNRLTVFVVNKPSNNISPVLYLLIQALAGTGMRNYWQLGVTISRGIFLLSYFPLVYMLATKKSKGSDTLIAFMSISFALFIGTFLIWFMPWYFTTMIALLVLYWAKSGGNYYYYVYALSFYGFFMYLVIR